MRIRSVLAFLSGAAVGAGAMYLNDPDLGPARRREARRDALGKAKQGAAGVARSAAQQARDVAVSAVQGYTEASETERR
ncbi:hypothetical protein FTX61_18975 [Nitriliruptoraceae bacterium ZYF776]|nr:hypothetical protein [Profundirhabdus halotolerans]